MQHPAPAAADWLAAHGWAVVPGGGTSAVAVRGDAGLTQHAVEIDRDSAAVGCGMAGTFLLDVDPAAFAGGLLCVSNIFPWDGDNLRFARRVIRGCGAAAFDWGQPLCFQIDAGEHDVALDLLALAILFEWDAALFVAGRRLVVETDHDAPPALIADHLGDRAAAAMTGNDATVTPWPFRSRFLLP